MCEEIQKTIEAIGEFLEEKTNKRLLDKLSSKGIKIQDLISQSTQRVETPSDLPVIQKDLKKNVGEFRKKLKERAASIAYT